MNVKERLDHALCRQGHAGMSCGEYARMRERANESCEICGIPEPETPRGVLCIDHDHQYGNRAVRGLVCDRCNYRLWQVDSGASPADDAIRNYFHRAWFMEVNDHHRRLTPLRRAHPDWDLWCEFGKLTLDRRGTMRELITQFIRLSKSRA